MLFRKKEMDEKTKQQEMLRELHYEVGMFNHAAIFLTNHLSVNNIQINTYVESFLMHARNLIDFLEDWKDKNDVRCSDFGILAQSVVLPVGNTKQEINKYLSHITKQRIKTQSPDWKFDEIRNEINQKIKNFLEMLPDEFVAYRDRIFREIN